jgi:AraC-like DNA-binding protein
VVSGVYELNDGVKTTTFNPGDIYFCSRNSLAKYAKYPEEGGEFRSVSIFFDQEMLRRFSLEFGAVAAQHVPSPAYLKLHSPVLAGYMDSLRAFEELFKHEGNENLLAVKQKEAILILLKANPELKNVLFDFSEPGKIDLEAFMNRNYHFNVALQRFAYLTGRSLSTFKRDFERIFQITPSRWLLKRRLQEAYYLIKEQKKPASDVYLDVGFEDLSHFSFAFKKQYGIAPSMI